MIINRARGKYSLCLALPILLAAARGPAQSSPTPTPTPCVNQSPRDVTLPVVASGSATAPPTNYNFGSSNSLITINSHPEQIQYNGGTLWLCDQHYHAPVENVQGCKDEQIRKDEVGNLPDKGQWIEVHTVFSKNFPYNCRLDGGLDCCKEPPFVVRAYSAQVKITSGMVFDFESLLRNFASSASFAIKGFDKVSRLMLDLEATGAKPGQRARFSGGGEGSASLLPKS